MVKFIDNLLPREGPLYYLNQHANKVSEAIKYLNKAVSDYFEDKPLKEYQVVIEKLEREADIIKAKLGSSYTKLKFVYFERQDLMALLHKQDSVIDGIDDVMKILNMNKVESIKGTEIESMLKGLADSVTESVEVMIKTVKLLLTLVESSFSPYEVKKETDEIEAIENFEFATDNESIALGKKLYSMKETLHPVDIYFLEKLTMTISDISDDAENVAEAILLLLKTD
ncbi:MAG: DUF47 family protein [Thermotogota bacterium]|nr:DUF47 family protein [Thermotogota bacterium]